MSSSPDLEPEPDPKMESANTNTSTSHANIENYTDDDDDNNNNEQYSNRINDDDDNMDLDYSPSPPSLASSSDLHETRPNRWRGHPSTWIGWTERDRQTWTALENARRADLAVHLYNVAGLRRGWREGPDVEVKDDGADQGIKWAPDKRWTAWPMRADEVPDDALLPRTVDVNEVFTLRREQEASWAGGNLEEEVAAIMLRRAKNKFRSRGLQTTSRPTGVKGEPQVMQSIEKEEGATTDGETDLGDTTATSIKSAGNTDTDTKPKPTRKRRRVSSPTFAPVVSADDDRSYTLLRPMARRILSKLDDTLMILHNQRVAALGNMSESSADEDETDVEGEAGTEVKTEAETKADAEGKTPKALQPPPKPKRGGGRPKKVHVPREGETEREMLVRLAREGKRKLPTFSSDESELGKSARKSTKRSRSRGRSVSRGRRSVSTGSHADSRSSRSGSRTRSASTETNREKLHARWGMRDWRDVLGAAALAGFSPAVMARAAQRCATLLKEDITLHTLHEQPATSARSGMETVRYVAGGPLLSSSDDESDSEEELLQLRTVSRQSSVHPALESSPEPKLKTETPERSRSGTPGTLACPYPTCPRAIKPFTKKSNLDRHIQAMHIKRQAQSTERELTETDTSTKRRSRSGTPGPALHVCPYASCPRAIEGFAKWTNLARHLRDVHGRQVAKPLVDTEEDSMDEMDGGVHVDGFLKPIKIRKGWRGNDAQQRQPRTGRKRRKDRDGSEELDSMLP